MWISSASNDKNLWILFAVELTSTQNIKLVIGEFYRIKN
ncbi:hypothetical protein D082_50630 (plasmid) [Synechocystis sp. PCC 6714]|nr:hypothetical protein D082_50630 [Synechocystis sp. PCC 6714]